MRMGRGENIRGLVLDTLLLIVRDGNTVISR